MNRTKVAGTGNKTSEAVLRLPFGQAIRLYRLLNDRIRGVRVKDLSINDDGADHMLTVHLYTEDRTRVGNDPLQEIIAHFS